MTFNITTLRIIMALSIMTHSIKTFSIMDLIVTLRIKDAQHNDTRNKQ